VKRFFLAPAIRFRVYYEHVMLGELETEENPMHNEKWFPFRKEKQWTE